MHMLDDVRSVLAPPNRAGWPFIGGSLVIALAGLLITPLLFWLGVVLALFCLYFFRDPERFAPARPTAIVAPADGRVVSVMQVAAPAELGLGEGLRWRVAIFLSVLDVHINRVPIDGTVMRIAYHPGAFVSASMDKASESNERNAIALKLFDGRDLAIVQIAGLIARRIICQVREGQAVQGGSRFGLIRFGSRTDLYLPVGVRPLVREGQRMVGGESVIAELGPVP